MVCAWEGKAEGENPEQNEGQFKKKKKVDKWERRQKDSSRKMGDNNFYNEMELKELRKNKKEKVDRINELGKKGKLRK